MVDFQVRYVEGSQITPTNVTVFEDHIECPANALTEHIPIKNLTEIRINHFTAFDKQRSFGLKFEGQIFNFLAMDTEERTVILSHILDRFGQNDMTPTHLNTIRTATEPQYLPLILMEVAMEPTDDMKNSENAKRENIKMMRTLEPTEHVVKFMGLARRSKFGNIPMIQQSEPVAERVEMKREESALNMMEREKLENFEAERIRFKSEVQDMTTALESDRNALESERIRMIKGAQETRSELNAERIKLADERVLFERQRREWNEKNKKKQIQKQREKLKAESKQLEDDRSEFEHQRQETIRNQTDIRDGLKAEAQRLKQWQMDLEQREAESKQMATQCNNIMKQTQESLKISKMPNHPLNQKRSLSLNDIGFQSQSQRHDLERRINQLEKAQNDTLEDQIETLEAQVKQLQSTLKFKQNVWSTERKKMQLSIKKLQSFCQESKGIIFTMQGDAMRMESEHSKIESELRNVNEMKDMLTVALSTERETVKEMAIKMQNDEIRFENELKNLQGNNMKMKESLLKSWKQNRENIVSSFDRQFCIKSLKAPTSGSQDEKRYIGNVNEASCESLPSWYSCVFPKIR